MRRPLLLAALSLSISTAALAGPLDVSAPASFQTLAALAPATQKVYPPLPTLAMLPTSIAGDDDPPVKSPVKRSRKVRRAPVDCKCSTTPEPRLVVSDDSRAYLLDVERRLDAALAQ